MCPERTLFERVSWACGPLCTCRARPGGERDGTGETGPSAILSAWPSRRAPASCRYGCPV